MRDVPADQIRHFVEMRFVLEQNLALKLLDAFNTEASLIGPLRRMAQCALEDMVSEKLPLRAGVFAALSDEKMLGIWTAPDEGWHQGLATRNLEGLKRLTRTTAQFTASQCSDVIRLYGAVAEKCAGMPQSGLSQQDTLKAGYRPGTYKDFQGDSMIWNTKKYRVRGTPAQATPLLHKAFTAPGRVSGIDFKQPTDKSTIRKIDFAFGLPIGADISGTTADSLYFVERFARRCGIPYDPIYQFIAPATLVSHRHHSLLESALTMTLNKKVTGVTYKIGFYDSLLPEATGEGAHEARGRIEGILRGADASGQNRHILVYFDPQGKLMGGYECGNGETGRFKELATTGEKFLWRFAIMPSPPTKRRIRSLMDGFGLS